MVIMVLDSYALVELLQKKKHPFQLFIPRATLSVQGNLTEMGRLYNGSALEIFRQDANWK
jgi:hypothetical protein